MTGSVFPFFIAPIQNQLKHFVSYSKIKINPMFNYLLVEIEKRNERNTFQKT